MTANSQDEHHDRPDETADDPLADDELDWMRGSGTEPSEQEPFLTRGDGPAKENVDG